MRWHKKCIGLGILSLFVGPCVFAQVIISEVMYDLSGSDTGREWVEITNTGNISVEIATSTWKFFESNTNHSLTLVQGSSTLLPGGFALIVDNPQKFLLDWPGFSGTVFDSTFSLGNVSETLVLKESSTSIVDQVLYNSGQGAGGDGNSLQKVSGVWKALFPTPGLASPSEVGSSTAPGAAASSASTTPNTSSNSESSTKNSESQPFSNWPTESEVLSRIIGPTLAIAGADITLKGEARGLEKKPIENPRFVWNFGDGTTKEGESVLHAYNFPGDYLVILDVSSGKFVGTSRLKIVVVSADIAIVGVIGGAEGKIELINNLNQELDVSWWRIESGGKFFTLPKNTKILSRGKIPLAARVLGFSVDEKNLSLLYPNGGLAYRFTEPPEPTSPAVTSSPPPVLSAERVEAVPIPPKQEVVPPSSVLKNLPSPNPSSQAAAVGVSGAVAPSSKVSGQEPRKVSSFWLYGLGGVIILGLGAVLFSRKTARSSESPADEFTIIED